MTMNDLPRLQVLITTNEQYIDGELILPENMRFSNSIPDNILFYILNGGFQFISLKNCEVKDRKNLAFRPDKTPQLHVSLACIMTIQILEILDPDFEYDYENNEPQEEIVERSKSHQKSRNR